MAQTKSKDNNTDIHFIVGMPRCGITFLSRCMNLHSEIAVFGQSRFWGRYYLPPSSVDGYNRRELDQLFQKLTSFDWTATVGEGPGAFRELSLSQFRAMLEEVHGNLSPPVLPKEVFMKIAKVISSKTGKRMVFEKTPHHQNWIDRISHNFPNAKFVSIQCDPYLFLQFQKNQSDLNYNPIGHSLLWKSNIISYEKAIKSYDKRVVRIKTENLMEDLSDEMNVVWDFFDLSSVDTTNQMVSHDGLDPSLMGKELTDVDFFWINTLCRKQILKYRGNVLKRPIRLFKIIGSIFLFPIWLMQIGKIIYNGRLGSFKKYIGKWLYLSTR